MKIALVILHADPARGGAERYTVDLAAALAKRGHEVSILASSFGGAVDGVSAVGIRHTGLTRAARYRRFLDELDAHLAAGRYDIVHAMLPVRCCDVYHPHAGIARDALRKTSTLFNPRRWSMAGVEADLVCRPDGPVILSLSDYVKSHIRRAYPKLPERRIVTLFNAVDLERFQPSPVREGHKDVWGLIIANDFERKGVGPAIRAVEKVNDRRLSLRIVGRGDIAEYDRATHWPVQFYPYVDDPREMYAKSDFFVLPTKHDPCSLVVLEALAMGLPVVSTRFNGACEIMSDGVHGYVLDDPGDVDGIATAMKSLLDPQRRLAMREACLELRPRLSYENHLDRLIDIYQSIRQRRDASAPG